MKSLRTTLVMLAMLLSAINAQAQSPLKVGITTVPPFAMQDENGQWEGISIDLWQQVANQLGRETQFVELPFNDLLSQVERGEIDVAVGALTMTAEREARFEFSHPFYQTGLSIAVPSEKDSGILSSLGALLSWSFIKVILALAGLLLGIGFLLWLVERRRNPEQFGGSSAEGIGASFWWAAVTMTTVGYGDKAPVTLAGRLIALVWMFAGLIMVASFTAAITSSLTVNNLQGQINGPNDLPGNRVATIANTASEEYLKERRIDRQTYPDLTSAMESVARGETDAIVYDRALLQYRNQKLGPNRLTLRPGVFDRQLYALALPEGSPLRAPLAEAILGVTESPEWSDIRGRYLGTP